MIDTVMSYFKLQEIGLKDNHFQYRLSDSFAFGEGFIILIVQTVKGGKWRLL